MDHDPRSVVEAAEELLRATTPANTEADRAATDICRAWLAGTMDEAEARHELCVLIDQVDIVNWAVRHARMTDARVLSLVPRAQWIRDVYSHLPGMLAEHLMNPNSRFTPEPIAQGQSFTGYLRRGVATRSSFDIAGVSRSTARLLERLFGEPPEEPAPPVSRADIYVDWDAAADRAEAAMSHTRAGSGREARAVRVALEAPRLCTPTNPKDRDSLQRMIASDRRAPWNGLVAAAFYARIELPDGVAKVPEVDDLLMSLWDDYPPELLETMCRLRPEAIYHLAAEALAPLPRPSKEATRELRRHVRARSNEPSWPSLVPRLCDAFLAVGAEIISPYDASETTRTERMEAAQVMARAWPRLALAATRFAGAPLGTDIAEVEDQMRGMLSEILDAEDASRVDRELGTARA